MAVALVYIGIIGFGSSVLAWVLLKVYAAIGAAFDHALKAVTG
jgi:uncharacterized membrane protein (DUF485 family)